MPLQKFGVVVPFFAMSQRSAQPPIERRSMHAHCMHEGSVVGVPMQLPVLVSHVSPARQSESDVQPGLGPLPPMLLPELPPAAAPPLPPLLPQAANANRPMPTTALEKNQFIFIA
jgi:hypothetical protein